MITCPFCNAAVNPRHRPTSSRVLCNRCGEPLDLPPAAPAEPAAIDTIPTPSAVRPLGWFRPAMAGSCVLALVLLVVGIILINRDPSSEKARKRLPAPPPDPVLTGTVPPLAMVAVSYLPSNVQIAFGLQTLPLEEYRKRVRPEAAAAWEESLLPPALRQPLQRLGVSWSDLDSCAVGLHCADDNAVPSLYACLILRKPPADPTDLTKKIANATPLLPLHAAFVNESTILISTDPKFSSPQTRPKAGGGDRLTNGLRDNLFQRVSPASFLWIATDDRDWSRVPFVQAVLMAAKRDDMKAVLAKGHAATACLSFEPEPTLGVAVKCRQLDDAQRLQNAWGVAGAGHPWLIGGTDGWALVDLVFEPKDLTTLFSKLLPLENKP